jgi:hypothetical protein
MMSSRSCSASKIRISFYYLLWWELPMSDQLQRNQLTARVAAFIVMTIIVCGGVFVLIHYWLT